MSDFKNNILEANLFIKTKVKELEASGCEHSDLLLDIFALYETCKNDQFKEEIEKDLKKQWLRGKDISTDTLMDEAEFSYITLVDQNQWDKRDHRDDKILALTSSSNRWSLLHPVANLWARRNNPSHRSKRNPVHSLPMNHGSSRSRRLAFSRSSITPKHIFGVKIII